MYENLALSENGFLFDTKTGNTFSLNKTGSFLLRQMIDGTSTEKLVDSLVETFDVDPNIAGRDVEQFLFRLKDLKVTEEDEDYS